MKKKQEEKKSLLDSLLNHLEEESSKIPEAGSNNPDPVTVSCRIDHNMNEILEAICSHYRMKKGTILKNLVHEFAIDAGERLGLQKNGYVLSDEEKNQLKLPGME